MYSGAGGAHRTQRTDLLDEVPVAGKIELLAGLLEDVGQVCSRVHLDRCPPQVGGDHHDVGSHDIEANVKLA